MSEVLQLGASQKRQRLAVSSSFVNCNQASYGIDLNAAQGPSSSSAYVTQLVQPSLTTPTSTLLSYTDDGAFRQHDKATLGITSSFTWNEGGPCTSIHPIEQERGFLTSGRNGLIGWWDQRLGMQAPSVSAAAPSHAPYLCSAVREHIVAAGTELHGTDATIDIWDLRQPQTPLLSYNETHSDDVTTLAFHPSLPYVLLSAASDALVAISDTRQANEDDSVVGVVNTGASVARAGWGGSQQTFAKTKNIDDDDNEAPASSKELPLLGAFYSVSDMQTVGMWEADGFTELLPVRDVRQTYMKPGSSSAVGDWQTEYVIDASTSSSLLESGGESIGLFCGNQEGVLALVEIPNAIAQNDKHKQRWSLHCLASGGHTDVVRCATYDAHSFTLFTGGEDGRICAWKLANDGGQNAQAGGASSMQTELPGRKLLDDDGDAGMNGVGPQRNPLKQSSASRSSLSSSSLLSRGNVDGSRRSTKPY